MKNLLKVLFLIFIIFTVYGATREDEGRIIAATNDTAQTVQAQVVDQPASIIVE